MELDPLTFADFGLQTQELLSIFQPNDRNRNLLINDLVPLT